MSPSLHAPSGFLHGLQQQVEGILQSDPYYSGIRLLSEQLGDIQAQVRQALAKLGLCCIVVTPDAQFQGTNAPGPIADPVEVSVDVTELVLVNRGSNGTGIPASAVAEHTAWLLHYPNHAHHREDAHPLTARRIRLVPDKTFLIYRCEFTTTGALAGIIANQE